MNECQEPIVMKKILGKPLFLASSFLMAMGVLFSWIQNTFYGYIDANNVLQDSIFLPLGAFSIILGLMGFIFMALRAMVRIALNH